METSDDGAKHFDNWLILIVGLLTAIALWSWWLFDGMDRAHTAVLRRVIAMAPPTKEVSGKQGSPSDGLKTISSGENDRERVFVELGQTGDSFGGLNALLTAIAGSLVAWAGFMQHQMLKKARQEAKEERTHRQLQEFEALFFQLLNLSSAVTDRIEGPKNKGRPVMITPRHGMTHEPLPGHMGPRALDSYAYLIYQSAPTSLVEQKTSEKMLEALVSAFLVKAYDRGPSAFGPYFRLLYQTFKHVAESAMPDKQQIRYANIARGQISEGAVFLLALNGLTYNGHKFVPLIEKFGLLEHLHPRYRAEFEHALMIGYRPRAFMGSEERAKTGNEWTKLPLLPENHFKHLERRRADADADSDFYNGYSPDLGTDA